jgi:beta-carotene/zeaxanthin 4-ketolase
MAHEARSSSLTGLLVAAVIIAIWIASLGFFLLIHIDQLTVPWILAMVLGRTFIQTGLFIVAHDAMHGTVSRSARCNHTIGQLAVALYALLPYQKLLSKHQRHHRFPGQPDDPDFHDGVHSSPVAWYARFMQGYLDRRQQVILFFGIGAIFLTLYGVFGVSMPNLFLFWIIPIVFSSIQLFFFGTYLPHRSGGEANGITSSNYGTILSFLTCYHFGYHWEHHENPVLPWYSLPSAYQARKQSTHKST